MSSEASVFEPIPCDAGTCPVTAFLSGNELEDNPYDLDWGWSEPDRVSFENCGLGRGFPKSTQDLQVQLPVRRPASKRQRTAPAEGVHTHASDVNVQLMICRVHSTIDSLINGERIVQQTKAAALIRRTAALENYDSLIDSMIHRVNQRRVIVKDEIREVFDDAVKRLDAQRDELSVRIGQLQGLAVLLSNRASCEYADMKLHYKLFARFSGPVCEPFVELPGEGTGSHGKEGYELAESCFMSAISNVTVPKKKAKEFEGNHTATLGIRDSEDNTGLAVNSDATMLAVSNSRSGKVTLYVLPSGEELASFGAWGSGPGRFKLPRGLCFTADDTLLVVDSGNKRIQDISDMGHYIRKFGEDVLSGEMHCVHANEHAVVVSQDTSNGYRQVVMFDYHSGSFIRGLFFRTEERVNPRGLHITSAGQVYVAEKANGRVSFFSDTGLLICNIGSGKGLGWLTDVCTDADHRIIAVSYDKHEVIVFTSTGNEIAMRFGAWGSTDGSFMHPIAAAFAAGRLYVLDHWSARVQVFE